MLLTGLPGMGKSTALEQAAARWAADADAPVPVFVQLRDLVRHHPRRRADVTLPLLIRLATVDTPEPERAPLRWALEQALVSGEAVLLLDGLDECGDRRGVVADGLAAIARELPEDTGIVLATRDSGLAAAGKLNMPVAQLTEPRWLERVLTQLLRHVAVSRAVPEAEREQWVGERKQQVDEIRVGNPDLWRVPLLATLLTLLAARRDIGTLPTSRAHLLAEAVRDTVDRWELSRLSETAPYRGLRGDQLIDGYVEIAHAIMSGLEARRVANVHQQVTAMLVGQWGQAPAEARAHAHTIMSFWDEHVGVFVASVPNGQIEPRSRVFAEAGDAMWVARQDVALQHEWVIAALDDDDHREAVLLAAGLSSDVVAELIDSAAQITNLQARARALIWAADAAADSAEFATTASLGLLVAGLAQAACEAATNSRPDMVIPGDASAQYNAVKSPGWPYIHRIVVLPLPVSVRRERDRSLVDLALDEGQRVVATALAALTDAEADNRDILEPDQEAAVRRLLAMPLPERESSSVKPAQGQASTVPTSGSARLLPGHSQAAEQAVRYIAQLGLDSADAIYRVTRYGSLLAYRRVRARLTALGYPDDPERLAREKRVREMMTGVNLEEGIWEPIWKTFFEAAASIVSPRILTSAERWRYPHLATLADVLGVQSVSLGGIGDALTVDQALLPRWIKAVAHAAALDLSAISAEAVVALQSWPLGNRDVMEIIFAAMLAPPPECKPLRLDRDDMNSLVDALGATSEWLADVAYAILMPAHAPEVGSRVAALLPQIPSNRRKNPAIVAIANDSGPPAVARRLLDSNDPVTRLGAVVAVTALSCCGDTGLWAPVLDRASRDDDQAVRQAARYDQNPVDAGPA
jgi:hypothetical protein